MKTADREPENWGHSGRPGLRGGSGAGGGKHNRVSVKGSGGGGYTSFAKEKKKYATPHTTSRSELSSVPVGSVISVPGDKKHGHILKQKDGFVNAETGSRVSLDDVSSIGKKVSIAIPDSEKSKYVDAYLKKFSVSEDRMKNTKEVSDPADYDAKMRAQTGKIWRDCSDGEKKSLYGYTGSNYTTINGYLRDKGHISSSGKKDIENITKAVSKSEFKEDTWLYRGVGINAAASFFGISASDLTSGDLGKLVGMTGHDDAFMSCGSVSGKGFHSKVKFKIFAPAGTQGLYAEPFSVFGNGDAKNWNGKSKQKSFSGEFETILQRGTMTEVMDAKSNQNGDIEITMKVTGQHYSNAA